MNKHQLEDLFDAKAAPYLYRLAMLIAQHPLRWTGSGFVLGLALGLFL